MGPRVPAQAGASRSGRCAALGTRGSVTVETSSRRAHHLAVAHTGAAGGSHAGVDSSAAKARTGRSVGAHCPVASLRAPGDRVDSSHVELRPGLAFWGAELLGRRVGAAVAAARRRKRGRTLVASLSRRAGLAQAAGAEAGIQQRLGGRPGALVTALR